METFQSILVLLGGLGLIAFAWHGLRTGWLPFGAKSIFFDHIMRRHERPFRYWLAFVVYNAFGAWLALYGLRMLLGIVEPMPLT